MSGGHFDYEDKRIDYVIDQLKRDLHKASNPKEDEWGYTFTYEHEETFNAVQFMIKEAEKIMAALHEYDWFMSCDTNEEYFLERFKEIYSDKNKIGETNDKA